MMCLVEILWNLGRNEDLKILLRMLVLASHSLNSSRRVESSLLLSKNFISGHCVAWHPHPKQKSSRNTRMS